MKLEKLGERIDDASDRGKESELSELVRDCQRLIKISSGKDRVLLSYFEANAHDGIRHLKSSDDKYVWNWEQPEAIAATLALRQAISDPSFKSIDMVRRGQIRTNLGNSLNLVGRPVEAIEQWTAVMQEIPNFAMALGNRANGVAHYAGNLYDVGHSDLLLVDAYHGFMSAIRPDAFWDGGFSHYHADEFRKKAAQIAKHVNVGVAAEKLKANNWPGGECTKEIKYRQWALRNNLFLNPLNDISAAPIAATDVFHLQNHSYAWEEDSPRFVRFFDILKDEFVAARTFCHEGMYGARNHFSDKNVLLFDHFDCNLYGLRIQKLRSSFRMAYSIFDKIAFFLNDYFRLSLNLKTVSFRNVFYFPRTKRELPRLADQFSGNQNWPLRGLFALSKDLFDAEFQSVAAPEAKQLDLLRNALEHRFLSLHEYDDGSQSNDFHRRATLDKFQEKTVRTLKLARAALIYLSLAVRREEHLRQEKKKHEELLFFEIQGIPLSATKRQR